jgi:predicted Zn finger-like uncharacterized protein
MRAIAPALSAPAGLTILRCPRCAAAEPVETAALAGEARMIRCRKCGDSWPARAGLSARASEAASALLVPPYEKPRGDGRAAHILDDEPHQPAPRRHLRILLCGLAALTALALPASLLAGRDTTASAMPELAGLYAAVGLPVRRDGLTVEAVEAERRFGDTATAIKVGGRIVNVGSEERAVPALLIQFRDRGGLILRGARAEAPVRRLAPGAAARFVVEVESVPKEAGQVLVRLGEAR